MSTYFEECYDRLHAAGLVKSMGDYSQRYLLKSESYARTWRCLKKEVPVGVLASLSSRLGQVSNSLNEAKYNSVLALELSDLSNQIWREIYKKSLAKS